MTAILSRQDWPAALRVVVVDADPRTARLHGACVAGLSGFAVAGVAGTAAAALALIERVEPDLVLLDPDLPDGDGLQLLFRLRHARRRPVDVLVVTATRDLARVRAALQLGAVHYLLKPCPPAVLAERLAIYAGTAGDAVAPYPEDERSPVPRTVDAVDALVRDHPAGITALEVAARLGLSRATAQRHLSWLAARRRAEVQLRYRRYGRPQHAYRPFPEPPRIRQLGAGSPG